MNSLFDEIRRRPSSSGNGSFS